MSIEIKLSDHIKNECRKRGITVTALAKLSGVSKSTAFDWSTGSVPKLDPANIKNLLKLSDFMGISITKLIFGDLEEGSKNEVLYESYFKDSNAKYHLKITKITEQ